MYRRKHGRRLLPRQSSDGSQIIAVGLPGPLMTLWISDIFCHRTLPTNSNDTNRSVSGLVCPRITRIGEKEGGHDDNTERTPVDGREPGYRAHREEAR